MKTPGQIFGQQLMDDMAKSTADVAQSVGAGQWAKGTGTSNGRRSEGRIGGLTWC